MVIPDIKNAVFNYFYQLFVGYLRKVTCPPNGSGPRRREAQLSEIRGRKRVMWIQILLMEVRLNTPLNLMKFSLLDMGMLLMN
ncbi:hypothetical protein MTP99_011002 [Tenebrio molitor]|nr:hypothetical protein MTP99_011002 [Tenebrio molitor]